MTSTGMTSSTAIVRALRALNDAHPGSRASGFAVLVRLLLWIEGVSVDTEAIGEGEIAEGLSGSMIVLKQNAARKEVADACVEDKVVMEDVLGGEVHFLADAVGLKASSWCFQGNHCA